MLFFIIFPRLVKLPLAMCKGTREGGARGQEGRGGLRIVAAGLEEGPLEARRTGPCRQGLCSLPLQVSRRVLPASFGGQEAARSGCGALPVQSLAAVHLSAAGGQVRFHGVSHWIMPLLRPFTRCPCRGEGWVCADVSMPKSCRELRNEGRRWECCQRCWFSPLTPASEAAFTLCVVLRVCLEAARNPALSLALPSGQPTSLSVAFQDLRLSLGSSGGHEDARDCDQQLGCSPRKKSFR